MARPSGWPCPDACAACPLDLGRATPHIGRDASARRTKMSEKIALITGASRGLGAALAEALAATHH
ncbi:MAG: hypothetical protein V7698_17865, partial [Paracoccaceae bacterium]